MSDKHGYVLYNKVAPGNMHNSVIFTEIYENMKNICLDSGFNTSPICHQILSSGRIPFLPYKRPMTKKGCFRKYEYIYDEYLYLSKRKRSSLCDNEQRRIQGI